MRKYYVKTILFIVCLSFFVACNENLVQTKKLKFGSKDYGYYISSVGDGTEKFYGGELLIICGKQSKDLDILYYISDDKFYAKTNFIDDFEFTNIFYNYRYWKGVSIKDGTTKNMSYYWNSLSEIKDEKDKTIFMKLVTELSNRINNGQVFLKKIITNENNQVVELPLGILDNEKMKSISNFSRTNYYYEIKD